MTEPLLNAKAVFDRAHEITAPEERRAYLDQACGNNAELRQQVEALLHAYDEAGSFLNKPVATMDTSENAPGQWLHAAELSAALLEGAGSRIGQYKLLQQIGEGGMGVVFMAEQQEPVRRMVALKIVKAGMDTGQVIARFEAERQALAMMDHPNIAKVLDGGTTASGRPYFVMELVKGIPITRYCDEQRLSPRQRLEVFVPVCQAIQHAHQKGIIHRDIKPSNVLVANYDGKPMPKVIDFGVAKATGGKLTDRTLFTGFGSLIGTFEYMSPEQAEFNALDIDTRSDIYSLGVLLYELLTGTTPLTSRRLKEVPLMEVLRLIREEEPPRPSTRLSDSKDTLVSVSAQRQMEPVGLVKAVRGEVDWIVMKALEKDRTRRYETANDLARDIERYLAEEPVEAGPPSATYRVRKLAWKHRRSLAMAAVLLLLLVVGVVVSSSLAVWAMRAEKTMVDERNRALSAEAEATARQLEAEAAQRETEKERDRVVKAEQETKQKEADTQAVLEFFQDKVLKAGRPEGDEGGLGINVKLIDAVNQAEEKIGDAFKDRPLVEASIRDTLGETYMHLGDYARAGPQVERALALREAHLGTDHPITLGSRNNVALTLMRAGRIAEAIRLEELALKQRETILGTNHLKTLISRNNLAVMYGSAGRIVEGIRLEEHNLKQCEAALGPDHDTTLLCRNVLVTAYLRGDRIADALRLAEPAPKQCEAALGPEHPITLAARYNLAEAYRHTGRIAEAIRLHELTLKQREDKLGPNHSATLASRNNLAEAYDRAGQFAKAEPLLRDSLERTRKRSGAGALAVAARMAALASNLQHQHKYVESESIVRDSLKIFESNRPNAWGTFNVQSVLGGALLGQKKYAEAEPLLLSGYKGMKQREAAIPPAGKPRLSEALERLVQLYEAIGKKEEADKWRKERVPAEEKSREEKAKSS